MSTLPELPADSNSFSNGAKEMAEQMVDSLRQLAAFYEAHPEFPLPRLDAVNVFVHTKTELGAAARALAPCRKEVTGNTEDDWYMLIRQFGSIRLEVNIRRGQVCERVVVGKRVVPAHIVPARQEELIPEREEDITEWRCPELLSDGGVE